MARVHEWQKWTLLVIVLVTEKNKQNKNVYEQSEQTLEKQQIHNLCENTLELWNPAIKESCEFCKDKPS